MSDFKDPEIKEYVKNHLKKYYDLICENIFKILQSEEPNYEKLIKIEEFLEDLGQ